MCESKEKRGIRIAFEQSYHWQQSDRELFQLSVKVSASVDAIVRYINSTIIESNSVPLKWNRCGHAKTVSAGLYHDCEANRHRWLMARRLRLYRITQNSYYARTVRRRRSRVYGGARWKIFDVRFLNRKFCSLRDSLNKRIKRTTNELSSCTPAVNHCNRHRRITPARTHHADLYSGIYRLLNATLL